MSFNGNEGGEISLTTASGLTSTYRTNNANAVQAHFFGANNIQALLDQTGAVGIRIYHGEDDNGDRKLILVAVDSEEDDMLDLIYDMGVQCPPTCSTSNELNS